MTTTTTTMETARRDNNLQSLLLSPENDTHSLGSQKEQSVAEKDDWSLAVEDLLDSLDRFTFPSGQILPLSDENKSGKKNVECDPVFSSRELPPFNHRHDNNRQSGQTCDTPKMENKAEQQQTRSEDISNHATDTKVQLALKEAMEEREAARRWARDMREAVQKWLEDQRAVLQAERMQQSDRQKHEAVYRKAIASLEKTVQGLKHDLKASLEHYLHVETQLHEIILEQQKRIQKFEVETSQKPSQQIFRPKQTLQIEIPETTSSEEEIATSKVSISPEPQDQPSIPILADSNTQKENVKGPSPQARRRSRQISETGREIIVYSNGTQKEIHPDGTIIVRFPNGDIQTQNKDSTAYYFGASRVIQVSQSDDSTVWEFPSGQIERHWTDGRKIVRFPDGSTRRILPDGSRETVLADQATILLEDSTGRKEWIQSPTGLE